MKLPFDPESNEYNASLDRFAKAAIQSLPPPPGVLKQTQQAWWTTHSKLFTRFFQQFGTDAIVSASLGGQVEQYSFFDSGLETTLGKDLLVGEAQIDFTRATGIGSHSGTIDPRYKRVSKLVCFGGDPTKCNKASLAGSTTTGWEFSLSKNPTLLQHEVIPISELLHSYDPSIKSSLETAAEIYVAAQDQLWDSIYSNYTSCRSPFNYANDPTNCPEPPTPAPPTPAPCLACKSPCGTAITKQVCCPGFNCQGFVAAGVEQFGGTQQNFSGVPQLGTCCQNHADGTLQHPLHKCC
jgi:hypothetical protein